MRGAVQPAPSLRCRRWWSAASCSRPPAPGGSSGCGRRTTADPRAVRPDVVHRGLKREFLGYNRARTPCSRRPSSPRARAFSPSTRSWRSSAAPGGRGQDGGPSRAGSDGLAHRACPRPIASSSRPAARLHFGVLDLRGALGRRFGGLGAAIPSPSLLLEVARARDGIRRRGPTRLARPSSRGAFSPFTASVVGRDSSFTGRFRLTVGSAPALSSACRWPGRWRSCTAYPPSPPSWRVRSPGGSARQSGPGHSPWEDSSSKADAGRRRRDRSADRAVRGAGAMALRRRGAAREPGAERRGRGGGLRAASAAGGGGGGAGLPSRADVAPSRARRGRSRELRRRAFRGPADHRGLVRATAGWSIRSRRPGEALIRRMAGWGAAGVGQSSWGPAVYGLVEGADAGRSLAERCREFLAGKGLVYEGGFARSGARVGRGGPPAGND